MTRRPLAPIVAGAIVGAALLAFLWTFRDDTLRIRVRIGTTTTTTTTPAPFCEGHSLVIPNTGVVDWAPRCDTPPVHEPPGTGPTTGPNGERRGQ